MEPDTSRNLMTPVEELEGLGELGVLIECAFGCPTCLSDSVGFVGFIFGARSADDVEDAVPQQSWLPKISSRQRRL